MLKFTAFLMPTFNHLLSCIGGKVYTFEVDNYHPDIGDYVLTSPI